MPDADLLRAGVLAVLVLTVAAVAAVMRLHWRAWRRLPAEAGLTPLHVALVSLGVLIWGGTLAWAMVEALGRDVTAPVAIRTALYGIGAVVILTALVVVGGLQRRRVQFARSETVRVSSEDTVTAAAQPRADVHRR